MKKITGLAITLLSVAVLLVNCNDSATAGKANDTIGTKTDTAQTQIVTEGGLRDSLKTGASDSTTKDTSGKGSPK